MYDFDQGGNHKLDCTTKVNEVENLSEVSPAMIALFACRFSLKPTSKLSEKLVRYSLATVIGISEDRDTVCCTYPSEPLLASASAILTADRERLMTVLHHVRAAMHHENKLLDPPRGDAGEMCAAAMLGYAMDYIRSEDETKKDKFMCEPVELRDFLALFNPAVKRDSPSLDNWTVNFTHVVRMFDQPTQTDLKLMWKKRMACYAPERATGLDILTAIYNTATKCYGVLRVQVKNSKDKITPGKVVKYVHLLQDVSCLPNIETNTPSVNFLLCVNAVENRCHDVGSVHSQRVKRNVDGNRKNSDVLFELTASFPSIESSPLREIAKLLQNICETSENKKCHLDYFFLEPDEKLKLQI